MQNRKIACVQIAAPMVYLYNLDTRKELASVDVRTLLHGATALDWATAVLAGTGYRLHAPSLRGGPVQPDAYGTPDAW